MVLVLSQQNMERDVPFARRAIPDATMMHSTSCLGEEGVMPRRRVPVTETKAQKFERLANLRTNLILDGFRSLSNRNHYDYSEDEVERIFSTVGNRSQT